MIARDEDPFLPRVSGIFIHGTRPDIMTPPPAIIAIARTLRTE